MKEITWLLYLTVILSVCLGNANDYKMYYLEDPDLCSAAALKQGKIKLDHSMYSAAKLQNKLPKYHFLCRIRVKTASKTDGIIAVIQELALRRNESTGECIDYVELASEEGIPSRKFCGVLNAKWKMDPMFVEPQEQDIPVQENTFLNKIGSYLTIDVFISKTKYLRDEIPATINIVFTLYTACSPYNYDEFAPCREADYICIKHWFFNDGVINCPYPGCVDEGRCIMQPVYDDKLSIGSKVIISSMSSLVISFIVFVLCIYLCRKYKKFCWAEEFSNPPPPLEAQNPRVIEMQEQPSQSEEQANAQNLEKDLPPSYESLFPDR